MKTAKRPRPMTLGLDSLDVQSFVTDTEFKTPVAQESLAWTCFRNTQFVCGTGKLGCPACRG